MTAYPPLQQHQHGTPLRHHHGQGQGSHNKLDAAVSSSLRCSGLPTDARGLRAVIKSLSSPAVAGASIKASAVHGHAAKLGLDRERTVRNALISLYLNSGDPAAARALFDAFPNGRDVVSWTAMVTGLTRLGFSDSAASLFLAMMEDDYNIDVDAVSAAAGFAACADAGDLALARAAHRRVEQRQVPLDAVARNALIDMYARCGDLATARRLFNAVPLRKRNVVTWNTMIAALTRAGGAHAGDALALFREMQTQQHAQPDAATLVAVLGACARLGALDTGMWVHAYHITRLGRNPNPDDSGAVVANALIDMYAKCGAVDHAVAVLMFDAAPRRDAYTYASMITGLAAHGRAHDALSLLDSMPHLGVRPNAVTLLGALSACCHAGLVDEGLSIIRDMTESHGVVAAIEHYGCAVDMLGRAGRLDEAEALVAAMPVPPDAAVYGSLMAACRALGDVERAERIMRSAGAAGGYQLDAGDHVLLANTYAAKGRHGRALRVRKEMGKSKIVKDPGCSLIEIDGVVHEFMTVPANASIT